MFHCLALRPPRGDNYHSNQCLLRAKAVLSINRLKIETPSKLVYFLDLEWYCVFFQVAPRINLQVSWSSDVCLFGATVFCECGSDIYDKKEFIVN